LAQEYFPELLELDRKLFPPIELVVAWLGEGHVSSVPIPADCVDGFLGAYWRRPEAYLDPGIRAGMSSFDRVPDVARGLDRLAADLQSGAWVHRFGNLLELDSLDIGYKLLVAKLSVTRFLTGVESCRRSYGTRGGVRFAHVHRAILF
jgi:hypothetical protein